MIAASPIHEIEHLSFGLPELIPNHEVTVNPNPDQTVCIFLYISDHAANHVQLKKYVIDSCTWTLHTVF